MSDKSNNEQENSTKINIGDFLILQQKFTKTKLKKTQYKDDYQRRTKQNTELSETLNKLTNNYAKLEKKYMILERKYNKSKKRCALEQAEEKILILKQKIIDLDQEKLDQVRFLKNTLNIYSQEIEKSEKVNKELKFEIKNMEKQMLLIKKEIEICLIENEALKQENKNENKQTDTNNISSKKNSSLQNQDTNVLKNLKEKTIEELKKLFEIEKNELLQQLDLLKSEFNQVKGSEKTKIESIHKLKKQLNELKVQNQEYEKRALERLIEAQSIREEKKELELQIIEFNEENLQERIKNERLLWFKTSEQLERGKNNVEIELEKIKHILKNKTNQINDQKKELKKIKNLHILGLDKIKKKDQMIQKLEQENNQTQSKFSELQILNEKLTNQILSNDYNCSFSLDPKLRTYTIISKKKGNISLENELDHMISTTSSDNNYIKFETFEKLNQKYIKKKRIVSQLNNQLEDLYLKKKIVQRQNIEIINDLKNQLKRLSKNEKHKTKKNQITNKGKSIGEKTNQSNSLSTKFQLTQLRQWINQLSQEKQIVEQELKLRKKYFMDHKNANKKSNKNQQKFQEIHQMQLLLEETLFQNIQYKQNIRVMGDEIRKLIEHNKDLVKNQKSDK
ncbi:hypothetical protein M0812_10109 [Anaeramoeba flamelloides]|uniref:Uncharacterized protein n=1 Tax=Anaeramoeba flamelloides TaxID=1746091 RepID=A0AAV7ZUT6_9EUKA|nr:hypothetical protein M0812_10109 [Anaeramoeba flamelloides]